MVMNFKYGFYYKNRLYVWFEKKLYRYPFSSFGRYFGLKEIKPVNGNYRVCRDWVSKSKLQSLTTIVKVESVSVLNDKKHLPF